MFKKSLNSIRSSLFVVVPLVVMLGAAVAYSYHVWNSIGDQPANVNEVTALVLGGIGSLVLGGGLMVLVFFSSRQGYDDAADLKVRSRTEEETRDSNSD